MSWHRFITPVPVFVAALFVANGRTNAGPVSSTQKPQAKDANIEKAGEELVKGKVDESYKLLQEAFKKNPTLPPARVMLARLCFKTNSRELFQRGRQELELAVSENLDHPAVYLTNAGLAMGEHRLTDATLNAEAALKYTDAPRWTAEQKKSFQQDARQILASAAEQRNDWTAARIHLNALLELDKTGGTRSRLARALFFLNKPDDALAELQQAIKDESTMESPSVQMARLWAAKGDTKKAREWFDKAIKSEPKSLRVHLAYADWLVNQNEVEQAKLHCDAAEKIDATSTDVTKLKGLIARIQKDLPTAERIFRKAITDAPADLFASNQLALVLVDQTDKDARSKGLQLASVNANANQRDANAIATLGYAFYRTGQIDEALKYLQGSLQITNGQLGPDTAYYLAVVLNEKEKSEDARNILEGALKTKGMFIYRKEAQALYDRLVKEKAKGATVKPKS